MSKVLTLTVLAYSLLSRSTVQSPEGIEELSPDRALQRIREVVTDTSEHLLKV